MQPYPRSPDLVWRGHLHGTGCLSARALGTGVPTVVGRLCLGRVRGWVWVLLTPPVLARVLGGCVWAPFVVLYPLSRLFVVFVVGLSFRPAYGTCVVSCALRLPPAVSGSSVPCGRACWARVSAVPRPSWLGCRGVFCALFFSSLCGVGCWVSLSWALCSLSPHPLSFGLGCWLSFFSWCVSACFGVPFLGGPLFLAWSCRFWLGGLPVPLWGSCLRCLLGGGFGRLWWCWPGGLVAVGCFRAPPPSPFCCFFLGGGACLFLPLPSLGWRTHWPAFSVVFRAAVGGCVLFGRVPAPWVGSAMYTLGSAPLLAVLGPGSAGWAAAPGGCVWLWVRGLGLFVSFPLSGAGFNLLGGPPQLLPGCAVAPCVACGARVWRAGAAPSGVCGGLLWLVLQVRVSCAVLCRSVPRRVASCCGALHCGTLWCGLPWSRVVRRWVSGGQPGPCRGAECGPECGWLVAGGCG